MRNNQRYIILTFLAFSVALGFSVRGLAGPILAWQEMPDPRVFGVVDGSSLIGVAGGVAALASLTYTARLGTAKADAVWS